MLRGGTRHYPRIATTAKASTMNTIPELQAILRDCRTLAVVGLSAEWHRPSFFAAKYMQSHGYRVVPVNPRPGLADHPHYDLTCRQMRQVDGAPGASGLLAFGVKGGLESGVRFIESAQVMSHLANIGDTRTLIIHPASTTHRQLEPSQQVQAGVLPDMVRMSVGIEHIDDILWDIDQALAAASKA